VLSASALQQVVQRHVCVCCNSPHVSNVHVAERHPQAFYAVQACDALQVGDAERSVCVKASPAACCSGCQATIKGPWSKDYWRMHSEHCSAPWLSATPVGGIAICCRANCQRLKRVLQLERAWDVQLQVCESPLVKHCFGIRMSQCIACDSTPAGRLAYMDSPLGILGGLGGSWPLD
jgi:hypothetical protein